MIIMSVMYTRVESDTTVRREWYLPFEVMSPLRNGWRVNSVASARRTSFFVIWSKGGGPDVVASSMFREGSSRSSASDTSAVVLSLSSAPRRRRVGSGESSGWNS